MLCSVTCVVVLHSRGSSCFGSSNYCCCHPVIMSGAASASSASAAAGAVCSGGSPAAAEVPSAVADVVDHPDFWKDASKEWYGDCIKLGDDAGKYHFQWSTWALNAQARVTPNANGSTGWAWVLRASNGKKFKNQIRVHKCANNQCTADWSANSGKYGKFHRRCMSRTPNHLQQSRPSVRLKMSNRCRRRCHRLAKIQVP